MKRMVKYKDIQEFHDTINKLYNNRIILVNDREFKKAEDITNEIVGLRDRLNVLEREWIQDVEDNAFLCKSGNNNPEIKVNKQIKFPLTIHIKDENSVPVITMDGINNSYYYKTGITDITFKWLTKVNHNSGYFIDINTLDIADDKKHLVRTKHEFNNRVDELDSDE
ncbi:hypothetical protein [Rummeliibacillus suwonensis]|uniref:hypothetical protein n=1 Tax=Rummeliibacillus suwonensis TaxID=1306154 RepID=UPI0011B38CAD|nr:hypothetical protein [Rummeliibacillus suwonensis]